MLLEVGANRCLSQARIARPRGLEPLTNGVGEGLLTARETHHRYVSFACKARHAFPSCTARRVVIGAAMGIEIRRKTTGSLPKRGTTPVAPTKKNPVGCQSPRPSGVWKHRSENLDGPFLAPN